MHCNLANRILNTIDSYVQPNFYSLLCSTDWFFICFLKEFNQIKPGPRKVHGNKIFNNGL